jgi:Spy/CpxP family protein refolding chaperone
MKRQFLTMFAVALLGSTSLLYAQTSDETKSEEPAKTTTSATAAKTDAAAIDAPLFQLETKDQADNETFRGLTVTKKFSRRLPVYYGQLVSAVQKEEIYKIQQSYFGLIELLKLRIEKLEAERDAQIEAVLKPEQKEKLETLKKGKKNQ